MYVHTTYVYVADNVEIQAACKLTGLVQAVYKLPVPTVANHLVLMRNVKIDRHAAYFMLLEGMLTYIDPRQRAYAVYNLHII